MRIDYNLGMMSTRYKSGGHLLFSYNLGKMRLYRGLPLFFCSVGDTISSLNRGLLKPTLDTLNDAASRLLKQKS